MSNADIVTLTDAMVTTLSTAYANSLIAADIDVQRVYQADFTLEDMDDLEAGGQIMVRLSPEDEPDADAQQQRAWIQLDYRIQVNVAAKVPDTTNNTVDPVLLVIQQLRDFFFKTAAGYRPSGRHDVATKIETMVYFDRQRLIDTNVVLSGFILTFPGTRAR